MSRVFGFIKRRPKRTTEIVRHRTTTNTIVRTEKDTAQIADVLAMLEDNNEHQAYRDIQAEHNIPEADIREAYRRRYPHQNW